MADGWRRTLETLERSNNRQAARLLTELVFSQVPEQWERAIRRLSQLNDREAWIAILERWRLLGPDPQRALLQQRDQLAPAVRSIYVANDSASFQNACAIIREWEDDQFAPLLLGSQEQDSPRRPAAGRLLLELARRLTESLQRPGEQKAELEGKQSRFLQAIEASMQRFDDHHSPIVLEALLWLAPIDRAGVLSILRSRGPALATALILFRQHESSRILRWLQAVVMEKDCPDEYLTLISERTDLAFVEFLLSDVDWLAEPTAQQHLRHLETVRWLFGETNVLFKLNETQQQAAVMFLMQTKQPVGQKLDVLAHVLDEGQPRARQAAACALAQVPGFDANQILIACLDDADPEVQLAAVSLIRSRGLPNGMALLLPKLDHSDDRVRQAARQALSDYNIRRYLNTFEQMAEPVRKTTGKWIIKIDSGCLTTLRAELTTEPRSHRLRALHAIRELEMQDVLADALIERIAQDDDVVRRSAIETLAACATLKLVEQINQMLVSRSPTLRSGAREAIASLRSMAVDPRIRQACEKLHAAAGAQIGLGNAP